LKKFAVLVPALTLIGCATPQEQCINNATSHYRAVISEIADSQRNISRGYAVHTQSVPYVVQNICYNAYGYPYSCSQTLYRTQETPVAIDVVQERRKVAEYQRALPEIEATANNGASQCRLLHPA